MNENDFMVAVGEAAQDAVWKTEHPLTHQLEEDSPLRAQYLREYQSTVGRQVVAAIMHLQGGYSCKQRRELHWHEA